MRTGADHAGVWRRSLSELVTSCTHAPCRGPERFMLYHNYPNPFNPSTTVQSSLPRAVRVIVKVYSLVGTEVATLGAGEREAGVHRVVWDGRDLSGRPVSSGVYFIRLEAEGCSLIRRALLLR